MANHVFAEVEIFCVVTLCSVAYHRRYSTTTLHGVTTQKTATWTSPWKPQISNNMLTLHYITFIHSFIHSCRQRLYVLPYI